MLDEIEQKETQIDILFNDAGVQVAYRREYYKTPAEDFTQSFMINTIAPAIICYRLLPKMIENGFGRVINTTSGIRNEPEQAGYSASKAALDKFTKDLGSKLEGTNILMNLTDPGWCRTDLGGPHAPNDVKSCIQALQVIITMYLELREPMRKENLVLRQNAQERALEYFNNISERFLNGNK
jgi:short-subunit dehydrogenase